MNSKIPIKRNKLGHWLKSQGLTFGIEIGVETGKFSKNLCDAGLELICVDPWLAWDDYRTHLTQLDWNHLYDETIKRLAPYRVQIWRMTSEQATIHVKDKSLDFAYLDARHDEDSVKQDIGLWLPKVRSGGILAGHDYNIAGVQAAVLSTIGEPLALTSDDTSPSWIYRA